MEGKRQAADADRKARLSLAWHVAAFHRAKRLPDHEEMLRDDADLEPQTPADMIAVMRSIQAAGGDVNIEIVDASEFM